MLNGRDGDDTLYAGKWFSVLDGGAGAEHMIGSWNEENYLYHELSDSFVNDASGVSSIDFISDFDLFRGDVLDVAALGYTGLGDGHDGTLKLIAPTSRTTI
ncbi:hypothetical protein [Pseudomonas japonica]|uniref:hypothetical protein n=1 Tax=Pseudomonas japonica TaxID=256466 RepID=UPI0015E27A74|nr:hypothetical protein [Pseudomonas japonica]